MVFGKKTCSVGCSKATLHAKVDGRNEVLDGALSFYNHPHCYRLHSAGAQAASDLLPKHGRELKTHKPIQHPASLLGVDQVHVDLARIVYRL